ncbi:MAG: protein translocase subunit SecF [Clostridiales bacterium]|jgi:preprotein translocase SecF subunit|nr:protein translocase subunit SecF [Clostridiales bacterium]
MRIVEKRLYYLAVSIFALLVGVVFMIVNGASGRGAFNFDVEFSGGTSFQIDIGQSFNNDDIAAITREVTGQNAPQVQKIAGENQVMIRLRSIDQETRIKLIGEISAKYNLAQDAFTYSDISPTISSDMQRAAVLAVAVACVCMLIYISVRFRDIRMGTAAVFALLHDSLVMIAFYAILRIPLNYSFIAAVLTILGYSINATIVIFDRIRENKVLMRRAGFLELVNNSIRQTMRRSVFTSLTVFMSVLVLYIVGVSSIKEFALPIMIGVVAGGYSSIFLAGSFWYMLAKKPETKAVATPAPEAKSAGSASSASVRQAAQRASGGNRGKKR